MPLFVIVNGNVYLNKPDLPKLGETLREMAGELKKPKTPEEYILLTQWTIPQKYGENKYPLKRDKFGKFIKP